MRQKVAVCLLTILMNGPYSLPTQLGKTFLRNRKATVAHCTELVLSAEYHEVLTYHAVRYLRYCLKKAFTTIY
jgi:hypothetical protein